MGRSGTQAVENLIGDIFKGAGSFELIPGRQYGLMRTTKNIVGLEVYDIRLRKLINSVKALDPNTVTLDSYAVPLAVLFDVARLSKAVYKDQGFGSRVASTSLSIAASWGGGYGGAILGYRAGEFIGGLFGQTAEGIGATVFGYVGGVFGAHFGNHVVSTILPDDD